MAVHVQPEVIAATTLQHPEKPTLSDVDSEKQDSVAEPETMPPLPWLTMVKLDVRLVVTVAILYTLSISDRTNIAIARIAGMNEALGLNIGNRYSVLTLSIFPAYMLAEIPANYLFVKRCASRQTQSS